MMTKQADLLVKQHTVFEDSRCVAAEWETPKWRSRGKYKVRMQISGGDMSELPS